MEKSAVITPRQAHFSSGHAHEQNAIPQLQANGHLEPVNFEVTFDAAGTAQAMGALEHLQPGGHVTFAARGAMEPPGLMFPLPFTQLWSWGSSEHWVQATLVELMCLGSPEHLPVFGLTPNS